MSYATSSVASKVAHLHEDGKRTYCGRPVLRVLEPEEVGAGLATGRLHICGNCRKSRASSASTAKRTAAPVKVATNAFEQAAAGLLDVQPTGRYALQVCEDPRDVCERDACTLHSTRASGTLDEVREVATMFRHAWAVDSTGARIPLTDPPIEEAIVEHPEEAHGCLPQHVTNPEVHAVISILELCGLAPAKLWGDDGEQCHDATGFWVEPRGGGRLAIHHLENGQLVMPDGGAWRAELNDYRAALRTVGWNVEPLVATCCVFAHVPDSDLRPDVTPAAGPDVRNVAQAALAAAVRSGNVAEVEGLIACFPDGDRVRQARTEIIRAAAAQRVRIGQSRT
ncbi:hypothetical protein P3T37_004045 [Kitasatospora sp. MAA4]|uniref:hypothetical protein n=1 Tax=Kitasatospora sp. MAA4 TaxID=3035093 RepID=UPI002476FF30|nr:hypothetical protein [Kitasatospora sp. MAA4]MDH6134641.1 hypothetical protein [Kitasatospora sp. MAA4]